MSGWSNSFIIPIVLEDFASTTQFQGWDLRIYQVFSKVFETGPFLHHASFFFLFSPTSYSGSLSEFSSISVSGQALFVEAFLSIFLFLESLMNILSLNCEPLISILLLYTKSLTTSSLNCHETWGNNWCNIW